MFLRMACSVLICLFGFSASRLSAEELRETTLPFDREVFNRYSLDHLPRSISIRQGDRTWLGYDLEQAKLYKAWQAPDGQTGLKPADPSVGSFVVRSRGTGWFEDRSESTWELQRDDSTVPLQIRYLGSSQRQEHFELQWELKSASGKRKLDERIPMRLKPGTSARVVREIRVEPLMKGETLLLPRLAREDWELIDDEDRAVPALTTSNWYRLLLP